MSAAIGSGIILACILALPTLGFNLNLAVSNVVNVGFVVFIAWGMFLVYVFQVDVGMNFVLASALGVLATGLLSVASWRGLVQPFIRRNATPVTLIIVLFALFSVSVGVMTIIFGNQGYSYNVGGLTHVIFSVSGFYVTSVDLALVISSLALIAVVHTLLTWTPLGRSIRAIADDEGLARLSGCHVNRVVDLAWFMSGVLAGFSGVLFGLLYLNFDVGSQGILFLLILAAAFAGGAGRPLGALIGAAIIGLGTQLLTLWIQPALAPVAGLALLCLTIVVRPGGVLGFFRQEVRA